MTKKQKKGLWRIIATAVLVAVVKLFSIGGVAGTVLYLAAYLIIGYDILRKAFRGIIKGQVFDENFLMAVATVGAIALAVYERSGDYLEAVAVMLFYQIGELFQSYAVGKSRRSITALMDIRPDYANIEQDGKLVQVDPDDVEVGDIIVIKPGEKIPLDGKVVFGESMVDTSALTGESVPRTVKEGDDLVSGCVNGNGLLRAEVTKEFDDSTVAKILELVENASSKKAHVENFITRFARYYTPAVVIGAVVLAVIPPLFAGQSWAEWVRRACTFLVISCPCALVISVPMSFFSGIGAASKKGVLVKGSNYLEIMSKLHTVVFDKTGTLTKGEFKVARIYSVDEEADTAGNGENESGESAENGTDPRSEKQRKVLELAALAESYSDHPISRSIRDAWGKKLDQSRVSDAQEISGHGVKVKIDGKMVLAGNGKLMDEKGISYTECDSIGTVVYVAEDGRFLGSIVIADGIKDGVKDAIQRLKRAGVSKTVMLTGDRRNVAEAVAKEIGLDEVHAQLLPGDKVDAVESLMKFLPESKKLAFVGDGINDAPVLSRADVGIAMGSMGSDAAIEAADVVLMDDDPGKIADIVRISRKTMGIVMQNIVFALGVKFVVLAMGAFGVANMWEAVFADVGVSVIAILNAMRALKA